MIQMDLLFSVKFLKKNIVNISSRITLRINLPSSRFAWTAFEIPNSDANAALLVIKFSLNQSCLFFLGRGI